MALLLPVTFSLDPSGGVIMLAGIFYGAMYGGSTTSILLRIPGEAASIVTCIDGYEMARKGRAGAALSIAALGSFVGGTLSIVGLMLFAPYLADIMLSVGPAAEAVMMAVALLIVNRGFDQRAEENLHHDLPRTAGGHRRAGFDHRRSKIHVRQYGVGGRLEFCRLGDRLVRPVRTAVVRIGQGTGAARGPQNEI